MNPREESLIEEAQVFARYLIGMAPSVPIAERYAHAIDRLSGGDWESGALRWARRSRRLLPLLDAACGLWRPDDSLRRRLLVMTAILETTPEYADYFLPRHLGRFTLTVHLAWYGAVAALKVAAGTLLLPFIPRDKR